MLQNYRLKKNLKNRSKESNFSKRCFEYKRIFIQSTLNKKADLHWDYIIGFIIVAFLIIFGLWFAYKSGKFTLEIWPQF